MSKGNTIAAKPDVCKYTGLGNANSRADHDSFHSTTFNAHKIRQMLRICAPISLEGVGAAAGRMSPSSTKLTAQHDVGKGGGSLDAPFDCAWLMRGPDRGCRRIRPGCIARHWLQSIWIPGAPCNSPPICILYLLKGVRGFEGNFGATPCGASVRPHVIVSIRHRPHYTEILRVTHPDSFRDALLHARGLARSPTRSGTRKQRGRRPSRRAQGLEGPSPINPLLIDEEVAGRQHERHSVRRCWTLNKTESRD